MIRIARKKPVSVRYLEFVGVEETGSEAEAFLGYDFISLIPSTNQLIVRTLEGELTASPGDLLIEGVNGEHYPCKPDIFAATYEEVEA